MKSISARFTNASLTYDVLTDIQAEIAQEMVSRFQQTCPHIKIALDVGTGTGRVAKLLQKTIPSSRIVGIDISQGMLAQAAQSQESFILINADALALPFLSDSFEGIVSASTYQWVAHLPQAFGEARRCLKPGGVFMMVMFGENTFEEMFRVITPLTSQHQPLKRLPSVQVVRTAFEQCGWQDVSINVTQERRLFPDLWSLLKWIKNIGANGLNTPIFLGKKSLVEANALYRSQFPLNEGIQVSFELIWVTGIK